MKWTPHITVAAVIEKDNRFLLVQENIAGQSVINQPAGHLEENENLFEATRREVLEETGWHYEPTALVGFYLWKNPTTAHTYLRFCFTGHLIEQDISYTLDPVIEQVLWLNQEELSGQTHRLRSPLVMRCIQDYLTGNRVPLTVLKHF